VEKMKTFYFRRECKNFDDITKDKNIRKHIDYQISWANHLILGFSEETKNESIFSYIVLKYGDYIINGKELIPDRTPVIHKDYTPDDPKGYLKRHPINK
jgi:hypothetical protein